MAKDYSTLITNAFRDQPRFMATVGLVASAFGEIYDQNLAMTGAFSIDEAVGAQLDTVGLWVGISRQQSVPIANAYFSWNVAGLGWNEASWKGPNEPTEGITILDDTTYRAVIKAKIGSNYWNGTNQQLNEISQTAFVDLGVQCFVIDNYDMSVTVYIIGKPTAVLIELIRRGIMPPKPAGVRVAGYILASESGAPFFALSTPTGPLLAGLDFGSFV